MYQPTFRACQINEKVFYNEKLPYFSAFTRAYKTGKRLYRAYESPKNQTYLNWEWVVVDDSPADHIETWQIATQLANLDNRAKIYKINATRGGNIMATAN
jgi:glycosyltransferase involved in cell wall biosynthesis